MVNLSKCKFGDRLRTKSGQMAILCGKSPFEGYLLVLEGKKYPFMLIDKYDSDGTCRFFGERANGKFDIIGKWEDEK